jgi:hypothetical protein
MHLAEERFFPALPAEGYPMTNPTPSKHQLAITSSTHSRLHFIPSEFRYTFTSSSRVLPSRLPSDVLNLQSPFYDAKQVKV